MIKDILHRLVIEGEKKQTRYFTYSSQSKYLYNVIREDSFLSVALTLTLTMVDYTDTFNELIYI